MNIFDILGPVMVGPSSSHTAGAVKIGYISQKLLKEELLRTDIYFYGSFAATGIGHGTDKAVIAGLLGMRPDDSRIPDSFWHAKQKGLEYSFYQANLQEAHPNTLIIDMTGKKGRQLRVQAASLGGGQILINKLDEIEVNFTAEKPTLIVHNQDQPGHVAKVTSILAENRINIASMQLYRNRRGGYAVMVLEADSSLPIKMVKKLEQQTGILKVTYLNMEDSTETEGQAHYV